MTSQRRKRTRGLVVYAVAAAITASLLSAVWNKAANYRTATAARLLRQRLPHLLSSHNHARIPSAAMNSTLGFEKIVVLSMPNRYDRRDDAALLGKMRGLDFSIQDGVAYTSVDHEGMPFVASHLRDNEVGCWRAHVNAWRTMVEEGQKTVLFLEDDADFDQNVKQAMQQAQAPLAVLLTSLDAQTDTLPTPAHPWMDNGWDMIYFGACLETAWNSRGHMTRRADKHSHTEPPMVAYTDDTVANRQSSREETQEYLASMGVTMPEVGDDDHSTRQRIVIQANVPWCLTSYALTQRGARKLLYLATREILGPVDEQPIEPSQTGELQTYVYFPPLFDQFKVTDSFKNSDINELSYHGERVFQPGSGSAFHIRDSARKGQAARVLDVFGSETASA